MPCLRPSSTTLPANHGSSRRLPRNRSLPIEVMWWSGIERSIASALSTRPAPARRPRRGRPPRSRCRLASTNRPGVRVGAVPPERHAGQRVDVGERHQDEEFLPKRHQDVRAEIDIEPGRRAQASRSRSPRALIPPSSSPKVDPEIGAGLAHHPRRDDRAGDKGGAAHHRLGARGSGSAAHAHRHRSAAARPRYPARRSA